MKHRFEILSPQALTVVGTLRCGVPARVQRAEQWGLRTIPPLTVKPRDSANLICGPFSQNLLTSACNTFHNKKVVSAAHGIRMRAKKLPVLTATSDSPIWTGVSSCSEPTSEPKKQPQQKAPSTRAMTPSNIVTSQCLALSRGSVSTDDTKTPIKTQATKVKSVEKPTKAAKLHGASDQAVPLQIPKRTLRVQIFNVPIRISYEKLLSTFPKIKGQMNASKECVPEARRAGVFVENGIPNEFNPILPFVRSLPTLRPTCARGSCPMPSGIALRQRGPCRDHRDALARTTNNRHPFPHSTL
jgi:hypothetical protein